MARAPSDAEKDVDPKVIDIATTDEGGLITAIVSFFDAGYTSPSRTRSPVAAKMRSRQKERQATPPSVLRR